MKLSKRLRTGIGVVALAAIWAAFDAFVHVRADMVEPLRIAGNIAVVVAWAISVVAARGTGGAKLAATACGVAAAVVLGLNVTWAVGNGELPAPAAVFIGVAVVLLLLAGRRFLGEAAAPDSAASAVAARPETPQ